MVERLVIDPVTRITGGLRVEANVTNNRITEAYLAGTTVRGVELILAGRDPREAWALTQRICGSCSVAHGIAAVRAVEHALDYSISSSSQLIEGLLGNRGSWWLGC
ncbi:hypothetical protein TI04_09955 [Achromatium sp. WMS2]|nr:hypothetical protein TI04_09955 [Achromatium sp. WMS2]